MQKGVNYRITKLGTGPLQKFKNQNLLIKKFGETGPMIYKAITGKRTTAELLKDLEIDSDIFNEILEYMEDKGMVKLTPADQKEPEEEETTEEAEEKKPKPPKAKAPVEEAPEEEEEKPKPRAQPKAPEEEIKPIEEEAPAEEEAKPAWGRPKAKAQPKEEEITPIEEEIKPEPSEPVEEEEGKEAAGEEKKAPEEEEIKPVEFEEKPEEEENPSEEENKPAGEEAPAEEAKPAEEEIPTEELKVEEEEITPLEAESGKDEEEGLSPVEKIIKDKYGEVGIKVYTLIDGQRTAEEIMKETGLTESKLVEMLDFMDEEGIIKLEYPGEKKKSAVPKEEKIAESEGFKPMTDESELPEKEVLGKGAIEVPLKAPGDVVAMLYLRTKTLMKFGEKGGKVFESIDGKTDVLELSLNHGVPIYQLGEILNFLMENKAIMFKPLGREDIRKKYGDDGYSIYKKYGKEGVLLFELVGKDMKIKDVAKFIYKDVAANKEKIADMFLFIHQILKIDLPVDRELLYRELGGS
jgi:hypothetical protein